MNVRVRLQGLSPGVQDAEKSELGPEMLGVGRHFQQGGRRGLEQEGEKDPLVLPDQRHERMRQAEDQVVVTHGQEFLLALVQPLLPGTRLTLRAMPVTAGVVRDGLIPATEAAVAVPAQRSRTAVRDRREHFDLRPGQRLLIAFQELASCLADDIGHLPGWPCQLWCSSIGGLSP